MKYEKCFDPSTPKGFAGLRKLRAFSPERSRRVSTNGGGLDMMINGSIRFLRNHSPCVSLHILSSPIYWTYRRIAYLFLLLLLTNSCSAEFKLGIENIPDEMVRSFNKKKTRIGLITNQTGKDQKGIATLDVLLSKGFNIVYLFAPEHGFDGMTHASVEIKNSIIFK